ncbi:MAG: EamA family transporter [Anaerolineae bacterium]|nr:EamA family transporter [Anaerolineae bacterium]
MPSHNRANKISPLLAVFIAILAVSTASPLIRFSQQEASSIVVAAYRLGLASLLLFPFAAARASKEIGVLRFPQKILLAFSGLFLALHFASWITSLQYTSVASSVVLVSTTPLWVAILSPVLLGEKLSPETWIGLTVAILGGVIVGTSSQCSWGAGGITCSSLFNLANKSDALGNFLAVIGAWCAAGYLLIGRRLRPLLTLNSYTFGVYGLASVFLLLGVWVTGSSLTGYRPITYIWFLSLAVIPQLIGHSTFNWSLKYLSASYVSIAMLGEPVGTIILTFFLLGEKPSLLELIGGVLILGGITIATDLESKAVAGRGSS